MAWPIESARDCPSCCSTCRPRSARWPWCSWRSGSTRSSAAPCCTSRAPARPGSPAEPGRASSTASIISSCRRSTSPCSGTSAGISPSAALLLDTLNADFVRTARATGLTRVQAIRGHALRTSLIPTATSVAFSIPAVFTGAIITETIFGWEGMGRYFTDTIAKNDVHGVVAVAAFGAVATAVGAILSDIATVALDPRVRAS